MDGFSPETYTAVFPEYYSEIRPEIEKIDDDIAKIRKEKDVGDPNFENFQRYANHMRTLKGCYEEVLKRKGPLVEYEQKLKNKEAESESKSEKKSKINTIVQIIVGILLVIFGYLLSLL